MKRVWIWGSGTLLLLALLTLPLWWTQPRAVFYELYRQQGQERAIEHLEGYRSLKGKDFVVHYSESDADVAQMVLDAAERAWAPVTKEIGYTPSGPVPLILYPDRDSLRQAFGWSAQESALGVYWRGVIRVLSPHVWLDTDDAQERADLFGRLGPIPHEFTHYVLDYMTEGNYPRWFTEGLAQSVEYHVNGYQWIENTNRLDQKLYTLNELAHQFDDLSNQALAYRESFCMVEYLYTQNGPEGMRAFLSDLSRGESFEKALQREYNLSPADLDGKWLSWTRNQPDLIDPS